MSEDNVTSGAGSSSDLGSVIERATQNVMSKIKSPLDERAREIVRQSLDRLNVLATRTVLATSEEIGPIAAEAKGIWATLASIGDAAAAEVQQIFLQQFAEAASALIGRGLSFVATVV